ncbi:MAG: class I SAM-dependent methyltransferase [Gaiellaceae bacterium]
MTDRVARRPHGKQARETYGAPDIHDRAWEPVLAALALTDGDRLLDVGCGGGSFLRHVRDTVGCEVVGVDHSRDMVRVAAPYAVRGRAEGLPFRDGEFTAVSSLVCATRPSYEASVASSSTPAAPYPLATRGHFYEDDELVALAREAGFREARLAHREPWAQLLFAR